jgi:hypothetical protein
MYVHARFIQIGEEKYLLFPFSFFLSLKERNPKRAGYEPRLLIGIFLLLFFFILKMYEFNWNDLLFSGE